MIYLYIYLYDIYLYIHMYFPLQAASSGQRGSADPAALLQPPPPPRVPDVGPYGKGSPGDEPKGKGKASATAMWMAGQNQGKVPTGWKNYMVPLLGVPCSYNVVRSHAGCMSEP